MRSASLLICLAMAALVLALGAWMGLAYSRAEGRLRQAQLEGISTQFREELADARTLVTAQAELIANLPGVRQDIAAGDHQSLLDRLREGFDVQRSRFGMDILHAATRVNRSLARIHDPDKYGDDLSATRRMVVQANATGEPQSGLDTGPNGLRVRGVVTARQGTARVGTIEVGLQLDRVLDSLRRATGAEFAVLLDPAAVAGVARLPDAAPPERLGTLVGEVGTDWALFREIARTVAFAPVKAPATQWVTVDGHRIGLLQTALLDYSGRPIGILAAARNFDVEDRQLKTVLVQGGAVAATGALAIACLVLVLFRGLALRPVLAAAAQAEAMADGTAPPVLPGSVAPGSSGTGPVGRLFAALERLRAQRDGPVA